MKIRLITSFSELQAASDQWDRVAAMACKPHAARRHEPTREPDKSKSVPMETRAGEGKTCGEVKPYPFYRWSWMGTWFEQLSEGRRPYVLVAEDLDQQWLGIAPFVLDESGFHNQLRWWGSGITCTDYMGPICAAELQPTFCLAIADHLHAETKTGGSLTAIDRIELEGGTCSMTGVCLLDEALEAVGFQSHIDELEGCWVVSLPEEWETLDRRLSKSLRRKTKKAVKRLGQPNTKVRSSRIEWLDSLWPDFVLLHQARRQALGDDGCFANVAFEKFLKQATTRLVAEGQAELIVIDMDDRPLAAMLLFNDGQANYMYQSGADVDRMKLEPGYLMACLAIQLTIEQGMKCFDFLRGDEPYKSRWDTERIPLTRTRWMPRKFTALIKHNLWLTGRKLKSLFRSRKTS